MTQEQIAKQVLALPLKERAKLAGDLWQSIGQASEVSAMEEERTAIEDATRRDFELASGTVHGRSHQEVMKSARRALE